MSISPLEMAEVVERYWQHYEQRFSPGGSAFVSSEPWDRVEDLCRIPGQAAEVVVALLASAGSRKRIAYLAAGPLEDVVVRGDVTDLEILQDNVRVGTAMAEALTMIRVPESSGGGRWRRQLLDTLHSA